MIRVAVAIAVALPLWQCSSENKPTETATADNCPAAVTAFTSHVQPHIKADSCDKSGCHASATDAGEFALKAGTSNADDNRDGMLAKVKEKELFDASNLWGYLSGDVPDEGGDKHPGHNQLGGLNEAKLAKWVTAENNCE